MKRWLPGIGLFLFLTLVSFLPVQAKASWPEWAPLLDEQKLQSRYSEEKAVVLLDEWSLKVRSGNRSGTHRKVIRVLDEEGRGYTRFTIFRNNYYRFSGIKVWVRKSNGVVRQFFSDDGSLSSEIDVQTFDEGESWTLRPPGVVPGDTVALEYDFRSSKDILQDSFSVQQSVPVALMRVQVETGSGWQVLARVGQGKNPGPAEVTGTGEWVFQDLPPAENPGEGFAPLPPSIQLTLSYAEKGESVPFQDWNGVSRWAIPFYQNQGREGHLFTEALASLQGDPGDIVQAAGKLVRRIRYFAIELGKGGWIPREPETVLSRSFGDCKDKAQLMIRLLKKRGIEAFPVLISSPLSSFIDPDLPGPIFNHAIVALLFNEQSTPPGVSVVEAPGVGKVRLFDATLPPEYPEDISVHLLGARGLVIDPRSTGLFEIPVPKATLNEESTLFHFNIAADGSLRSDLERRDSGLLRSKLLDDDGRPRKQEDLVKELQGEIETYCPGASKVETDPLRLQPDAPWILTARFICDHGTRSFGDWYVFPLPLFLPEGFFPIPHRQGTEKISIGIPQTLRERLVVALPGPCHQGCQDRFSIENDIGLVTMTSHPEGQTIVIERQATLKAREVTTSQIPIVQELRSALRRANSAALIFPKMPEGKTGSEPAPPDK